MLISFPILLDSLRLTISALLLLLLLLPISTMPIRRKLEDAVPSLLRLLSHEATKGPNTQDPARPDSNTQIRYALLKEIREHFAEREDLFRDLKRTEDELLEDFNALEEEIDNSGYGIDGSRGAPAHPPLEKSIGGKFDDIKNDVSRFERLELKKSKKSAENNESEAQAREVSEKWSALKVERHILEHSAHLKNSVLHRFWFSYDNICDIIIDNKRSIPAYKIKLCLLCFSVFPPKSVIKKRPLIYWWLGEGLITDTEDGERIFGELIKKGFLIAQYKPYKNEQDKNPVVDSCTMHSWNLRMLVSVAKTVKFFDFDDDTGLPASHSTNSYRRCLVKQSHLDKQTPPNGEASKQDHREQQQNGSSMDASTERLLTLFNVNEQYLDISNIRRFSEENKIVVLQLGRWQDSARHHIEVENEDFLKALGTKKHLKYLSLRGISRITEIPSSVRKLVNLEILDLRACHNLEKLPFDISSLKKLTHLDISECHLLESMPKGLEKLTSLQVLKGFVVATSKRSPCKLGNLRDFNRLRKLSIYIRNEAYIEELSNLNNFTSLQSLSITWGERGAQGPKQESGKEQGTKQGSTMQPSFPSSLKKLDLWCIPEAKPAWLKADNLQSLSKLYIRGGKLVSLGEGSKKWRVQILRLKYLHDFEREEKLPEKLQEKLRKIFPYLIYMEIDRKAKHEHEHVASSSSS